MPFRRRRVIGAIGVALFASSTFLSACGSDKDAAIARVDSDGSAPITDGSVANADAQDVHAAADGSPDAGAQAADATADGAIEDARTGGSNDAETSVDAGADGAAIGPSRVVLFGGQAQGYALGDTWLFDGTSWTQFAGAGPPARAERPAMATLGSKALLFGGSISMEGSGAGVLPDGGHYHTVIGDDTWVFDGATWTHVAASPSPPARVDAEMAPFNGKLVLFGGQNPGAPAPTLDDTWTFDANSFATGWTPITTSAWPPFPISAAMASLNGKLILVGGETSVVGTATWSFDGTNWTDLKIDGPSVRFGSVMAALHGKLVLFGGFDNQSFKNLDETWTFDGAAWTKLNVSGPSARTAPVMAQLGDALVLFGGFDGQQQDDTWMFDGQTWTRLAVSGPVGRWYAAMTSL